jgi:hypothetical protein
MLFLASVLNLEMLFLCILCAFVVKRICIFLHGGGISRAIRRTSVISADALEPAAMQKCQFGGITAASRQSFRREICTTFANFACCADCEQTARIAK